MMILRHAMHSNMLSEVPDDQLGIYENWAKGMEDDLYTMLSTDFEK